MANSGYTGSSGDWRGLRAHRRSTRGQIILLRKLRERDQLLLVGQVRYVERIVEVPEVHTQEVAHASDGSCKSQSPR